MRGARGTVGLSARREAAFARRSLDQTWQEAMSELNELIHIENPKLDLPEGAPAPPVRCGRFGSMSSLVLSGLGTALVAPCVQDVMATPIEAFHHYRSLYVRYIRVLRKLARCYEGMKHPQKRVLVKDSMEWVMVRVVQVRGPVRACMWGNVGHRAARSCVRGTMGVCMV